MKNYQSIIDVYVKGLYQVSKENKIKKVIFEQILELENLLNKNLKLLDVLDVPTISKAEKNQMVECLFNRYLNKYIINFLKVLIVNNRINLIFEIIGKYKNIYYKNNNIQKIDVISAIELTDKEKTEINFKFEKMFNKKIIANYMVDADIIGGLIVKANEQLYDNSIKAKLNKIKKSINKIVIS